MPARVTDNGFFAVKLPPGKYYSISSCIRAWTSLALGIEHTHLCRAIRSSTSLY